MHLQEAIDLLKPAPIDSVQTNNWADLGSGTGLFTQALASLLADQSTIYAVDKSVHSISPPPGHAMHIECIQADFEDVSLSLPMLDGILMANALHYVRDQKNFLRRLHRFFPGDLGHFIMVEYDTDRANPWVPYPLSFKRLKSLFEELGYPHVRKLAERPSRYGHRSMYAAFIS